MVTETPFVVSVTVPAPATGACEMTRTVPLSVQLLVPVGVFDSTSPRPVHVDPRAGTALRVHDTPKFAFVAVVGSVSVRRLLVTPAAFAIVIGFVPVTTIAAPALYAVWSVMLAEVSRFTYAAVLSDTWNVCVAVLYRRRPSFALLMARFWPSENSSPAE